MSGHATSSDLSGTDSCSAACGCLSVAALTATGNVRSHNEDSFAIFQERGLLIVADGMGGQNAGAMASQLVVETLPGMIEEALSSDWPADKSAQIDVIRDLIVTLSQEVWEHARGKLGVAGMGATVVLALFMETRVLIAHMGDSRAYLYRDLVLKQLTDDHSVIALLLATGEITKEDAATHPARGGLSRYVGMEGEVYPDVQTLELAPGDRLLLCTDGLTGELEDEAIARILEENQDLNHACSAMMDAAKNRQAPDNITVVLAEWSGNPRDEQGFALVEDDSELPET